jgi:hypothetical protein
MHAAVGCHLCGILVGTYLFKFRFDPVSGRNPASITPSIEFRIHPASVPNLKRCAFSLDPYLPSNANRLLIEYFFQCCYVADSTAKCVFLINAGLLLEHCRTNFTPLFGIVCMSFEAAFAGKWVGSRSQNATEYWRAKHCRQ